MYVLLPPMFGPVTIRKRSLSRCILCRCVVFVCVFVFVFVCVCVYLCLCVCGGGKVCIMYEYISSACVTLLAIGIGLVYGVPVVVGNEVGVVLELHTRVSRGAHVYVSGAHGRQHRHHVRDRGVDCHVGEADRARVGTSKLVHGCV